MCAFCVMVFPSGERTQTDLTAMSALDLELRFDNQIGAGPIRGVLYFDPAGDIVGCFLAVGGHAEHVILFSLSSVVGNRVLQSRIGVRDDVGAAGGGRQRAEVGFIDVELPGSAVVGTRAGGPGGSGRGGRRGGCSRTL